MKGQLKLVILGVAVVVLLVLAAVAVSQRNTVDALGPCQSVDDFYAGNRTVGGRVFLAHTPLCPHGDAPVRVLDVELLGVPAGLRVHGIYAVDVRKTDSYMLGAEVEDLPRDLLHPVTDMVLIPGEPEYWYLVVELSATELGVWSTEGFRVTYQVGNKRGVREYPDTVGIEGVEHGLPECVDDPEGCPESDDDPWGFQPDCDSEYVHCVDPDDE